MGTSLYIYGVLGLAILVALALVGGIILLDQRQKARKRARLGPLEGATDGAALDGDDDVAEADGEQVASAVGPVRFGVGGVLVFVGIVGVVLLSLRSDIERLAGLLARPGAIARLPEVLSPYGAAIALAVMVVGGIAVFSYWSTTRRGAAFAASGSALGLTYEVSPDANRGFGAWAAHMVGIRRSAADDGAPATPSESALPALPLLRAGWNGRVVHALKGSWQGREVSVLDYHYTTGSGRSEEEHAWICALVHGIAKGPALAIMTRASLSLAEKLVDQPGVPTGSSAFDAAYRVDCANADYARSLIDDRMQALFLEKRITCRVEVASGWLMCAVLEGGDLLSAPGTLTSRITSLLGVLGAIVDQVSETADPATATTVTTPTVADESGDEPWRSPDIDSTAPPMAVLAATDHAAARLWQECAIDHDRDLFAQREEIESDLSDCQRAAGYLADTLFDLSKADPKHSDVSGALRGTVQSIGTYIGLLRALTADMPDEVAIPKLDAAQRDADQAYERFKRAAIAADREYRPAFPAGAFTSAAAAAGAAAQSMPRA